MLWLKMMISNIPQMMSTTSFHHPLDHQNAAYNGAGVDDRNHNSLLYSLSLLKNKVNEVQSLLSILISPLTPQLHDHHDHHLSTVTTVVQEIIVTASSMMFNCQQMMAAPTTTASSVTAATTNNNNDPSPPTASIFSETLDWYSTNQQAEAAPPPLPPLANHQRNNNPKPSSTTLNSNYSDDIIELDVAEILAKYTHYCQICGKGFKRDANLRMHMRAHGDQYKTTSALTNPLKTTTTTDTDLVTSATLIMKKKNKYSCPQEGCRWNQKHVKFQPLKSMICAKNHYKRSHCPKMYVCKQCNRKQFSVLSDLRTHEKHCGHSKWQCSCGTTFSRKDKLMGHVGLFVGHTPIFLNSSAKEAAEKIEQLAIGVYSDGGKANFQLIGGSS